MGTNMAGYGRAETGGTRPSPCMTPPPPVANYVGFVRTGKTCCSSRAQVCFKRRRQADRQGAKLGGRHHPSSKAMRRRAVCAINLLAQIKARARRPRQGGARGAAWAASSNSAPDFPRWTQGAQRRVRPDGRSLRRQGPPRPAPPSAFASLAPADGRRRSRRPLFEVLLKGHANARPPTG